MSGPCCFSGVLHGAAPVGSEGQLHGLDCYITEPPGVAKGVVVILSDIFGWRLPNTRALADQYAKRASVKVIIPDFFAGTPVHIDRTSLTPYRIPSSLRNRRYDDEAYSQLINERMDRFSTADTSLRNLSIPRRAMVHHGPGGSHGAKDDQLLHQIKGE